MMEYYIKLAQRAQESINACQHRQEEEVTLADIYYLLDEIHETLLLIDANGGAR